MKAIRDASPQARHHYTRFDQVNQLVGASEADPERGFIARLMALCSLPRTNPGNRKEYKRVNGPYTLYMQSGPGNKLPFGNLPRLLLRREAETLERVLSACPSTEMVIANCAAGWAAGTKGHSFAFRRCATSVG